MPPLFRRRIMTIVANEDGRTVEGAGVTGARVDVNAVVDLLQRRDLRVLCAADRSNRKNVFDCRP